LPHLARSFTALPGPDRAAALLAETATKPCDFAPENDDRPIALYGAGKLGRLACEFLNVAGRDAAMVIDRNASLRAQEPAWAGTSVLAPYDVPDKVKRDVRLAVSLVMQAYVPVERSLLALGFEDVVPFYDLAEGLRDRHPLSNGWFAPPLSVQDRDNTERVLAAWDDDISRAHHLQFIAWRRLREEWTFEPAPPANEERFFIPEVARTLGEDEILLDAGAHHGSVTESFVRQTKGAFRQVIAVEPDPASRATLERTLRSCLPGDERVSIRDCALAEDDGEAIFHGGLGYASQLSPTGSLRITTRRLDTLDLKPTFVKFHLEGGELAALKGAHATLLAQRPIIAATVYHNADGIWKTPLWLMQNLPDYRFLFRADAWCGTGAVLYGLPKERAG
jgi:FkbM family methyltransferase